MCGVLRLIRRSLIHQQLHRWWLIWICWWCMLQIWIWCLATRLHSIWLLVHLHFKFQGLKIAPILLRSSLVLFERPSLARSSLMLSWLLSSLSFSFLSICCWERDHPFIRKFLIYWSRLMCKMWSGRYSHWHIFIKFY